ncbi:MAG: hypothetical protein NXI04_18310 [Planctomycetaceae bacterium]|nr:hypothetical protein [Planctomycetaceae bacterium]
MRSTVSDCVIEPPERNDNSGAAREIAAPLFVLHSAMMASL